MNQVLDDTLSQRTRINLLFRSVFGSRREKNYLDDKSARNGFFYEDNFSLPDSPEPIRRSRVGSGNPSATRFLKKARRRPGGGGKAKGRKRKHSSKKKQPQIFLTRLPLNELQDPEIFFTKIIKENDSSVEIVPSDLRPDQLDALAHSPSLMFEEVPYHCMKIQIWQMPSNYQMYGNWQGPSVRERGWTCH